MKKSIILMTHVVFNFLTIEFFTNATKFPSKVTTQQNISENILDSLETNSLDCPSGFVNFRILIQLSAGIYIHSWELIRLSSNEVEMEGSELFSHELPAQFEESKCLEVNDSYKVTLDTLGLGLDYDSMRDEREFFIVYINDTIFYEIYGQTSSFDKLDITYCSRDADCNDNDENTRDLCLVQDRKCYYEQIPNEDIGVFGNRSVLAFRVITADVETTTSSADLKKYYFGSDENIFTFTSQFSACSYSKFNLYPFSGATSTGAIITGGVSEIILDSPIFGTQAGAVVSDVVLIANEIYGNIEDQFDFVIICLPPETKVGLSDNWKAYAYVNSYLSIYNDLNCIYPSVLMHEIGHNVGLSHSNDEENYGDHSGVMGLSYKRIDGPSKCFNGPKSWKLGWYYFGHKVLDVSTLPSHGKNYILLGISDYEKLIPYKHSIILKLINTGNGFDYYVTFNSNSNMNYGTSEGVNEILITKRRNGDQYEDSFLESSTGMFTIFSIDIGTDLYLFGSVNLDSSPQYATLSLSKSILIQCSTDFQCDDRNSCTIDVCEELEYDDYYQDDYFNDNYLNSRNFVYPRLCKYTELPCSSCGALVSVEVKTNSNPEDLVWYLEKMGADDKDAVMSSENYLVPDTTHKNDKCVEFGKYIFTLHYLRNETEVGDDYQFSFHVNDFLMDNGTYSEEIYLESFFIICDSDEMCLDYDGCTIDQCDLETNLCDNTQVQNCGNCFVFTLNITMDNFPEETTWELIDKVTMNIVLSGNPYAFDFSNAYGRRKAPTKSGRRKAPTKSGRRKAPTRSNSKTAMITNFFHRVLEEDENVFEEICLETQFLYYFIIRDSFGDGICCTEGIGYFALHKDGLSLKDGGDFTDAEEILFRFMNCTVDSDCKDDNPCSLEECRPDISVCLIHESCSYCGGVVTVNLTTDNSAHETIWTLSDSQNETMIKGGPYSSRLTLYTERSCLVYGTYFLSILDANYDGMSSCPREMKCGMSVSVNEDLVLFTPGYFREKEDHVFGICQSDLNCDDGDPCTRDQCDQANNVCIFDLPCTYCGKGLVRFQLYEDFWDVDTDWQLTNTDTNEEIVPLLVYSGADYVRHDYSACLPEGSYLLSIYDFNADGFLCEDGIECGYSLSVNNELLKESDGNFGAEEHISFYVEVASVGPSSEPSMKLSYAPSELPSLLPSYFPSLSINPSKMPSNRPSTSIFPSNNPSSYVSSNPSLYPIASPSYFPSLLPSITPRIHPSLFPSNLSTPSTYISSSPSLYPIASPSYIPSLFPSVTPSITPSAFPSNLSTPSTYLSSSPSLYPIASPSYIPSLFPSMTPSINPSAFPSNLPTFVPSNIPTDTPSYRPSLIPSTTPSISPIYFPSNVPSFSPSNLPSNQPSLSNNPSFSPSISPSKTPSYSPSTFPSFNPSFRPSTNPSIETSNGPSTKPSGHPSSIPNRTPSNIPSSSPLEFPTRYPSINPSISPSKKSVSSNPSIDISEAPSAGTNHLSTSTPSNSLKKTPTHIPSISPSLLRNNPSSSPTSIPTYNPSINPSLLSKNPSLAPSTACLYVNIVIVTDKDPYETTWELISLPSNVTVASMGPYSSQNFEYTHVYCIDIKVGNKEGDILTSNNIIGNNFIFKLYDSHGNGLCCDGSYKVSLTDHHQNIVIAQGRSFSYLVEVPFTVSSLSSYPSMIPTAGNTSFPSKYSDSPSLFPTYLPTYNPSEFDLILPTGSTNTPSVDFRGKTNRPSFSYTKSFSVSNPSKSNLFSSKIPSTIPSTSPSFRRNRNEYILQKMQKIELSKLLKKVLDGLSK